MNILLKSPEEIEKIRRTSRYVAEMLQQAKEFTKEGITTSDINSFLEEKIEQSPCTSAFKGYTGPYRDCSAFPASVCISVNDEIVHGIPGPRVLKAGDLVSLDFGLICDGYFSDHAISFVIGIPDFEIVSLLETTRSALYAGIDAMKAGNYIQDISAAIEEVLTSQKLGIIRDYGGHGTGKKLHEPPSIPNWVHGDKGAKLRDGMVLALEPMATLGGDGWVLSDDGWTIKTKDGSLAAHFEHTIAIINGKPEILTIMV